MSGRGDAHLWDAREACYSAVTFMGTLTEEEFAASALHRSAVERQLEILGEALNRLRRDAPDIAQCIDGVDQAVGMRNILAHEYGVVDHAIVWSVVERRLRPMAEQLDSILENRRLEACRTDEDPDAAPRELRQEAVARDLRAGLRPDEREWLDADPK